jgi:Cd2+/Zn2+-exporting ATPase
MEMLFNLEGLCCPVCAAEIERKLGKLPGVVSAAVDFIGRRLSMRIEDRDKAEEIIARALTVIKRVESDVEMVRLDAR